MEDRLGEQGVMVRAGLCGDTGVCLRVRRSGNGGNVECLTLGAETPDGVPLRYPPGLAQARHGLALAAALAACRPGPWPCSWTLRTPDGPRQVRRSWGRILVEYPAPLLRDLDPAEARALGLGRGQTACRVTLDGAALVLSCADQAALLAWRPPDDLGERLQGQGLACLVLCVPDAQDVLARSWLDSGQELPSPLAAGAAACLWQRSHAGTRVAVRWPGGGSTQVRLRVGPREIERLHLSLWAKPA